MRFQPICFEFLTQSVIHSANKELGNACLQIILVYMPKSTKIPEDGGLVVLDYIQKFKCLWFKFWQKLMLIEKKGVLFTCVWDFLFRLLNKNNTYLYHLPI